MVSQLHQQRLIDGESDYARTWKGQFRNKIRHRGFRYFDGLNMLICIIRNIRWFVRRAINVESPYKTGTTYQVPFVNWS